MVSLNVVTLYGIFAATVSYELGDSGCSPSDSALIQKHAQVSYSASNHMYNDIDEQRHMHLSNATMLSDVASVTVVSYNLYWWNVKSNNRWSSLYDRIKKAAPFDLIGFQECEDVRRVLSDAGLSDFDYYQGPNKPSNNPAPLAWSRKVFSLLAGPDNVWVANDRYGGRYMTWVRLEHIAGAVTIFFANTHGPLGNCGSTLGRNWANAVKDNKADGDIVFFTGDFNCWTGTSAMKKLKESLIDDGTNDVDGGIDQIVTDMGLKEWGGKREGWPSDHPLIKGMFRIENIDPTQGSGDIYEWIGAPKVGGWGGLCKCPSGLTYEVGDNYDSCDSLACIGGEVTKDCGENVISSFRAGWRVTCNEDASGFTPSPTTKIQPWCCGGCAGNSWCSPGSGSCYQTQAKSYYVSCQVDPTPALAPTPRPAPQPRTATTPTPTPLPACCVNCAGRPWCSPGSGNCYPTQAKYYYKGCPVNPTPAPPPTPVPPPCIADDVRRRRRNVEMCTCRRRSAAEGGWKCKGSAMVVDDSYVPPLPKANNTENAIKMMSYNVMGWSACGSRRRRGTTSVGARGAAITDKIKAWDPDVLGAQEVETGNGQDYESCHDVLVGNTNLDSGLYKHSVVEKLEDSWTNLVRGYWMSGARFKHKKSGAYFLFFNSHWKHGYGMEQAKTIANAIDAERKKFGNPPTILLGDTNQFCKGYESSAYRYLTGQEGSSPVKFVDVHEDDRGGSFGSGECRVDFIFASEGQWSFVNAEIDRDGVDWPASDHAALTAVLVPALKQTALTEYKVYES